MEACDWGLSNKTKLDIESPEGPTIVEPRRNFWLLHPLDCWKMHFLIPEKYSIINKYKTNSPSPKYYIIFAQISKIKFWKIQSYACRHSMKKYVENICFSWRWQILWVIPSWNWCFCPSLQTPSPASFISMILRCLCSCYNP